MCGNGLRDQQPPLRAAQAAESQQDFDRAVVEYTKVVRARARRPQRAGLARTGQAARGPGSFHARAPHGVDRQARGSAGRIPARGRARTRPTRRIQDEMRTARSQLRAKIAVNEEGKTRLETLIAQSLDAPLPGADLPEDIALPDTLIFREASAATCSRRSASSRISASCSIPTFRDQPITIDLRKVELAEALDRRSRPRRAISGRRTDSGRSRSFPTRRPSGASTRTRSCESSI